MTVDRSDAVLELFSEPVVLLRREGQALRANRSAKRFFGRELPSRSVFDFVLSAHDDFAQYLSLCSGMTTPLLGAVTFRSGDESIEMRTYCARLRGGGEPVLGLRCLPKRVEEFSLLTERVRDLDLQLRERLREKALLEEALREKSVLMRELQHRVKNNIQMMMSIIASSARGRDDPLIDDFIDVAQMRLRAMASAQEAIYRSETAGSVKAVAVLERLVQSILSGAAPEAALRMQIEDIDLPNDTAHVIALIVNELVTNAAKYGLRSGAGTVIVAFERVGSELKLRVEDSGPGIIPGAIDRASGLRLVRGLCRQIGAEFDLSAQNGTKCTIRFDSH